MTEIKYRKEPFTLQDKTDNTKKTTLDLTNLSTSTSVSLKIPDENGIIQTNLNHYRFLGAVSITNSQADWFILSFSTTAFKGGSDPSGAWNSTIDGYVVPITGYYSISLNVALNKPVGSDVETTQCGIKAGETTGSNNVFYFGERLSSDADSEFLNCSVKSILLNAGESIHGYGWTSITREVVGLNDGPGTPNSSGDNVPTYMSVRLIGRA